MKNIPEIINKGVMCSNLLESKVFRLNFKNENWPDVHPCRDDV
jgi:hypothetical protein